GDLPNRRLRPDAFEAKAEWWVRSREFFDGRIHEAPPIPTPIKLLSRYDVPKYGQSKPKPKPKPVEVREHYGLSDFDFSVLKNTKGLRQDGPKTFTKQTSSSFFDMAQRTPTYSKTFEEPISSRHPTSYPGTPHIETPIALQGFALWPSTNQAGPSQNPDVGGVNPDEMHRGKRETFPSKYQLSPFTCMPTTTVAHKKRANNIRNTTRNAKVSPFHLGNASIDLNSPVGELMYMGSCATDDYISLHNVDPNKVVRNKPPSARYTVAKIGTSAMLDKSNKFVIETNFHLMGMLDGSSRPYPSWDDVDIVYMPINYGRNHWVTGIVNLRWSEIHVIDSFHNPHRISSLIDHVSKWTNVLNVLLDKAGYFERTGRRPYKFELFYNQGLDFVSPQQGNTSDCVVVTCWVIENLYKGQAPLLYQADPFEFFSAIRVQMCLRLYDCHCEDTLECGYD
nr:hypothetical protein [Tanacetum cinerariifolium]